LSSNKSASNVCGLPTLNCLYLRSVSIFVWRKLSNYLHLAACSAIAACSSWDNPTLLPIGSAGGTSDPRHLFICQLSDPDFCATLPVVLPECFSQQDYWLVMFRCELPYSELFLGPECRMRVKCKPWLWNWMLISNT
jgi:hypothetical protein